MVSELGLQVIELREKGWSLAAIIRQLGCSKSTASKWSSLATHADNVRFTLYQPRQLLLEQKRRQYEKNQLTQLSTSDSYSSRYNACRREAYKAWLVSGCGAACQMCHYDKSLNNLVFHHLRDKLFRISGGYLLRPYALLREEASKCAILCHNCHGELHDGTAKTDLLPLDPQPLPDSVFSWYAEWLPATRPWWLPSSKFAQVFGL